MDLVSVIIPVYNAAPYLARCLKSVINQDYPNIEIILINDGSTDNSLSICQEYSKDFTNIRVIDQHNTGASIARKNGIQASTGKYLMFVDSDDYVSPQYVSALYNALKRMRANIAVCKMKSLNPGGKYIFKKPTKECLLPKEKLMKRFFKYEFWGYPGTCYERTIFENIIFPEATVNEDYYVKAQIFSKEEKVAYIDTSLYIYEYHIGSLSKQPLSLRALGEFDNALATWQYVKINAPKYESQALAIVSEAACKWLVILNKQQNLLLEYKNYTDNIKKFLLKHFSSIMINKYLLWKIKIVIILQLIK